ncbi:MAG: leucyl/phenylalanyl-tRNA--protein transferase [Porticoccaceae bacterium]
MRLPLLDRDEPEFPDPRWALSEPDGLLAVGGNLAETTLLQAYDRGIFPWYQTPDPILWWSPSIRCVIEPAQFHCSKSLRKVLRRNDYSVTTNRAFERVIAHCSDPRDAAGGTWISADIIQAYTALHHAGGAHSVEVWRDDDLIGGVYGVAVGAVFCGESMFSRGDHGSKIALAHLCRWGMDAGLDLLDCQLVNPHLLTLGASAIDRSLFLQRLQLAHHSPPDWSCFGNVEVPGAMRFTW